MRWEGKRRTGLYTACSRAVEKRTYRYGPRVDEYIARHRESLVRETGQFVCCSKDVRFDASFEMQTSERLYSREICTSPGTSSFMGRRHKGLSQRVEKVLTPLSKTHNGQGKNKETGRKEICQQQFPQAA